MNKEQIILGMKIYSQNGIDFILGEEEQKILLEHIDKLEHNWNELKKYIEGEREKLDNSIYNSNLFFLKNDQLLVMYDTLNKTLSKMQLLEEGGNNDNN